MRDCGAEYVGVFPVVIPKLKFSDVQMQIFLAGLVIGSNDAALQDRPEALDGLSMDRADDVLAPMMVNRLERIFVGEAAISSIPSFM
jgi:hypothetical protein